LQGNRVLAESGKSGTRNDCEGLFLSLLSVLDGVSEGVTVEVLYWDFKSSHPFDASKKRMLFHASEGELMVVRVSMDILLILGSGSNLLLSFSLLSDRFRNTDNRGRRLVVVCPR